MIKYVVDVIRELIPEVNNVKIEFTINKKQMGYNVARQIIRIHEGFKASDFSPEAYKYMKKTLRTRLGVCNDFLMLVQSVLHEYRHSMQTSDDAANQEYYEQINDLRRKLRLGEINKKEFAVGYYQIPDEADAEEYALKVMKENLHYFISKTPKMNIFGRLKVS